MNKNKTHVNFSSLLMSTRHTVNVKKIILLIITYSYVSIIFIRTTLLKLFDTFKTGPSMSLIVRCCCRCVDHQSKIEESKTTNNSHTQTITTWESCNNRDDIKRTSIRIFTKDFAIFVALAYARRLSWRQDDHVALMYLLTTRKELTCRLDRWRFLSRNLPEILQLLSRKHT